MVCVRVDCDRVEEGIEGLDEVSVCCFPAKKFGQSRNEKHENIDRERNGGEPGLS